MNTILNWKDSVTVSFMEAWDVFIGFLPALVGALLVFLIGIVIAKFLGNAAKKITDAAKIDRLIKSESRLAGEFKKAGVTLSLSGIIEGLVKWFLILVFLMAAADILGLSRVTQFLNEIVLYIPNIVVAIVVLSIAFILGNFASKIVVSSTESAGVSNALFLAMIAKWAIYIFGILAALIQLGIAAALANTIFIGIIAAISIAAGLAFGLGGKDEAAMILKKMRENLEK